MSFFHPISRKELALNHMHLKDPKDTNATCNYCPKVMEGGVYRAKQHLVGGFRNIIGCKKVPEPVKEDMKNYMLKKRSVGTS